MKLVDTGAYVSALRELTEQGQTVTLVVAGSSMAPFLVHGRDMICFAKPDRPLRTGDMVFYQRDNGQFVMHRIRRIRNRKTPDAVQYDIIGDGQLTEEPGVRRDQIFALVTKVRRRGTWIGPGNVLWELFAHVWPKILPLHRPILRVWSCMRKLFSKSGHGKDIRHDN